MAGLFLPFTPNGKATELRAIEVKRHLGLGPSAAVDPIEMLALVPARLTDPDWFRSASPEIARVLFVEEVANWSGICWGESPVDGASLILLNPTHAPTRRRATLVEEIVHIVLMHPKSTLSTSTNGSVFTRSHNAEVESEAFSVGAACLLPYADVFHAIRDMHETVASIARRYEVSQSYVEFRIKTAGLMRMYKSYCA